MIFGWQPFLLSSFLISSLSDRQSCLQAACILCHLCHRQPFLTLSHLCSGLNGRPHSALPSSSSGEGRELQQLNDRMGEVERLHSIVARDAAAMKAMGVLVEAKALKLDVHGKACAVSRSVGHGRTWQLAISARVLGTCLYEALFWQSAYSHMSMWSSCVHVRACVHASARLQDGCTYM